MAIRTGQTVLVQDLVEISKGSREGEAVLRNGFRSLVAIPLKDRGASFGAMMVYSNRTNGFSEEEVALLEEMTDDLAFGIKNLRAKAHQLEVDEELRQETALFEAQVTASLDGILVIDRILKG